MALVKWYWEQTRSTGRGTLPSATTFTINPIEPGSPRWDTVHQVPQPCHGRSSHWHGSKSCTKLQLLQRTQSVCVHVLTDCSRSCSNSSVLVTVDGFTSQTTNNTIHRSPGLQWLGTEAVWRARTACTHLYKDKSANVLMQVICTNS
jgi:hypothetical protein